MLTSQDIVRKFRKVGVDVKDKIIGLCSDEDGILIPLDHIYKMACDSFMDVVYTAVYDSDSKTFFILLYNYYKCFVWLGKIQKV
jgi:hypothetical protein